MSAPLCDADLIESLRAIILGVKVGDLPNDIVAALEGRGWLRDDMITPLGHAVLKEDGDLALVEIFEWLDTPAARKFFQE